MRAIYHQEKNIKLDFFESQHKSETRIPVDYAKKRNLIIFNFFWIKTIMVGKCFRLIYDNVSN